MKLIIDIPEYVYKACLGHRDVVYQYIANGTPYDESEKLPGKWEYQYSFCDEKLYKCTRCGRLLSIHNVQDISEFHFCQECGAKMKE